MERITLNIVPNGITPVCHASQFDIGRVIRLDLMDGMQGYELTDEDIELCVRKPDDNIVTAGVEVVSGNTFVYIVTTEQMTACKGDNKCELRITKGETDIGTLNFIMRCEEDPLAEGIESESEIHNLTTQIESINAEVVPLIVAKEVASQYDGTNVIFDDHPIEGHGTGYVVKSENVPSELNDLDDVAISGQARGEALVWDSVNNKWVNGTVSTVGGLNDLNDVTIDDTSLAEGQELVYDGTAEVFENKTTRVELTQAEYDALSNPLPNVDYYITDAPSMSGNSKELSYDGTTKSTYTKIEEVASGVDDCKVERQYYTGTTSAYGNIALGGEFDSNIKVIISATARNKANVNTVYIADIYQNDVNKFGTTYGLHIRNITDNSAVANTVIEGYIWLVKFTAT